MRIYQTTYKDKRGVEASEIHSNGSEMKISLRGIDFQGDCFETLEGIIDKTKFDYIEYKNHDKGDLSNCTFEVTIPIQLVDNEQTIQGIIYAQINIGIIEPCGIYLKLETKSHVTSNTKHFGYFENALIDLQRQLPLNIKIKSCLSCKYAHYHPVGNGMFGGLHCFKHIKSVAQTIQSKHRLMNIWEKANKEKAIFNVQETYDCSEHEFITNKDWNYSDWK